MKSTFKKLIQGLLAVPLLVLGFSVLAPAAVGAADCAAGDLSIECGANSAKSDDQPASLFGDGSDEGLFRRIVNIMLFIIGAVAVIMLIIGGIRYVVSGGDQTHVTAAKNTILYAIIGIVVAVLAFAVVNFVLTGINPGA